MSVFRHRRADASPHGVGASTPRGAHGTSNPPPGAPWPDEHPGPLLSSGTRADVYALDDERVLRRYRSGASAADEVEVVRHVTAHGFPAPEVYWAGGPEIVMRRLHGPTLLQAMAAGEMTLTEAADVLAGLHAQLHEIPALDPSGSGSRRTGGRDVVVHLDLHPAHVILADHGEPFVINWACARAGTAALDVAVTSLIIAEVVADREDVLDDEAAEYSETARAFLVAFLARTEIDPRPALPAAVQHRMHESRLVAGEEALVPAAEALVRHYANLRHTPEGPVT